MVLNKMVLNKKEWRSPALVCTAETVCCPPGGGMRPPAFAPGGGGSRPPPMGRVLVPPASFFLMFCDRVMTVSESLYYLISYPSLNKSCHCSICFFTIFIFLSISLILGLNAHANADLDGLPLFEAEVQFRCCALRSLQFCKLTFLFHPPSKTKFENIINSRKH